MFARGLWGVAGGIVASCALAAACTGPVGSKPGKVAAGGSASAARAPEKSKPSASPAGLGAIEAEVLAGINRHRRASGLRPLSADPRISEIARTHSRAMAAGRRGFGHGDFDDRSQAVESRVIRYRRVAENVSRHSRRRADVPAAAVSGWLHSSGHRRNIEGPFSLTGVGAAASSKGEIYLTQIFVAPR